MEVVRKAVEQKKKSVKVWCRQRDLQTSPKVAGAYWQ